MSNIRITEAPQDSIPKCPYCTNDLEEIWSKTEGVGWIGKERLLMCPHCQAILAYGAWRR